VGIQLGHAGAILGSDTESAQNKTNILSDAGAVTARSITKLLSYIT
jgi:succinyl-CoA synthetase alpha subunit